MNDEKSVGQVMAESKAGKELPWNILFWKDAFFRKPADFIRYHETRESAETEAKRILEGLGKFRSWHPAEICRGYERLGAVR